MNKVAAIIQTRMGSTRLPGKGIVDISGKSALEHIIFRLNECQTLDSIIVATPDTPQDEAIIDEVKKLKKKFDKLEYFKGSEEDVLDRYYRAAKKFGLNYIARITGDCPLIDPEVTDKVILTLLESDPPADFAANTVNRRYPRGLDTAVFTFDALEKSWKEAKEPHHREHMGLYAHSNPDKFTKISVEADEDHSEFRLTLDTEEDLKLIRAIYDHFGTDKVFHYREVVDYLVKNPDIFNINKKIARKKIK